MQKPAIVAKLQRKVSLLKYFYKTLHLKKRSILKACSSLDAVCPEGIRGSWYRGKKEGRSSEERHVFLLHFQSTVSQSVSPTHASSWTSLWRNRIIKHFGHVFCPALRTHSRRRRQQQQEAQGDRPTRGLSSPETDTFLKYPAGRWIH